MAMSHQFQEYAPCVCTKLKFFWTYFWLFICQYMTSLSNKWRWKLHLGKISFVSVLDDIQLRIGETWLQILCATSSRHWRFLSSSCGTMEHQHKIFGQLLTTLDQLTAELKSELDPENDYVSLSLEHPDLIAKSIYVPLQRPKSQTGQLMFTHIGKAVQSQHTLLLDGKMRLTVTVARGAWGSGRLGLRNAKNFNDY